MSADYDAHIRRLGLPHAKRYTSKKKESKKVHEYEYFGKLPTLDSVLAIVANASASHIPVQESANFTMSGRGQSVLDRINFPRAEKIDAGQIGIALMLPANTKINRGHIRSYMTAYEQDDEHGNKIAQSGNAAMPAMTRSSYSETNQVLHAADAGD